MTGLNYNYVHAVVADRKRLVAEISKRARMMAQSGTDHPLRRRVGRSLVRIGMRLSPQPVELVGSTRVYCP